MTAEQDLYRWSAFARSGGTRAVRGLIEDRLTDAVVPRSTGAGRALVVAHPTIGRLEFWSMATLPLSEVKARLSEIAEDVATTHERVQITKNGRDYVVLLAGEDLESLEATLELLGDPDAQSRIARSEEEMARGEVLDEAELRALLTARRAGSTE